MLMVYVVLYNNQDTEVHKEPIRGHALMSEAEHTKRTHENAMTRPPGTRDSHGNYRLVEIRQEG